MRGCSLPSPPPAAAAAAVCLRLCCRHHLTAEPFLSALQEMVVLVLDVGPRMHPHLEGAARAAGDFVVSKVSGRGCAAVALWSGQPARLLLHPSFSLLTCAALPSSHSVSRPPSDCHH